MATVTSGAGWPGLAGGKGPFQLRDKMREAGSSVSALGFREIFAPLPSMMPSPGPLLHAQHVGDICHAARQAAERSGPPGRRAAQRHDGGRKGRPSAGSPCDRRRPRPRRQAEGFARSPGRGRAPRPRFVGHYPPLSATPPRTGSRCACRRLPVNCIALGSRPPGGVFLLYPGRTFGDDGGYGDVGTSFSVRGEGNSRTD